MSVWEYVISKQNVSFIHCFNHNNAFFYMCKGGRGYFFKYTHTGILWNFYHRDLEARGRGEGISGKIRGGKGGKDGPVPSLYVYYTIIEFTRQIRICEFLYIAPAPNFRKKKSTLQTEELKEGQGGREWEYYLFGIFFLEYCNDGSVLLIYCTICSGNFNYSILLKCRII